ncbi:hypothetical protein BsWGS_23288 [Bradybaena similaris]
MSVLLALENPVFRNFLGYATLVLAKTVAMSVITSFYRMTRKVFINPEDTAKFGKKLALVSNDPVVERVRRVHLNDLENVVPFVLLGLLYVSTGPSLQAANLHFRIFAASRFIHSFVYLFAIPQPSRALAFLTGFGVNVSLVYHVLTQATF